MLTVRRAEGRESLYLDEDGSIFDGIPEKLDGVEVQGV